MRELATTAEVINVLGGNARVREITGAKSQQAVFNWASRGNFPPGTFLPINQALAVSGHRASAQLWKSVPVDALAEIQRLHALKPARASA